MTFAFAASTLRISLAVACLFAATASLAANQPPSTPPAAALPGLPHAQNDLTCQNELVKFEQTMGYLRQTSGDQAATTVQDKLLPAKTREELMAKEGPCGVVRYLRAKKVL